MNNDESGSLFGESVGESTGSMGDESFVMVEDYSSDAYGSTLQDQVKQLNESLDPQLQSMVDRLVLRLTEKDWQDGGYYISDVFACESPERAARLADCLAERACTFGRGFIGVALHGSHVHTIHSCAYSNRSCRCSFKSFKEAKEDLRRLLRRPRAVETFNRTDWENIATYFLTQGRRTTFFKIDGHIQEFLTEATSIPDARVSGEDGIGSYPSVEDCNDPIDSDVRRKRRHIPEATSPVGQRKRRGVGRTGGDGGIGGVPGVILDIIQRYAVCPLSEIVYTREYLQHQIAVKRLDDKDVKNAIDCHASVINTWNRADYVNFYEHPDTVKIWSARSPDLFDLYYMSDEESKDVINKLLDYQCKEYKTQFVVDLINVIDMNVPKCNCFTIISPPSAGKNFLCDAVKDYFLNTGQMQNPNKYNTFAYQDCHNRRLLIWNEPNYEPRETENLKMLFGGDNLSANVKCKPQANVKRTPVICLSNITPRFINDEAFADRVVAYFWQSAPFLKDYNKKPRPDSVMNLLYSIYDNK